MKVENGLAIKLDCDATVEIADGTVNTIVVEGNDADLNCCAIVCTGDLTVTGKGTLNITSGDYDNFLVDTGVTAYGIAAKDKTLLIEDGTLNISCGTKGANDANLRNI